MMSLVPFFPGKILVRSTANNKVERCLGLAANEVTLGTTVAGFGDSFPRAEAG
jgi:hypothetical protein